MRAMQALLTENVRKVIFQNGVLLVLNRLLMAAMVRTSFSVHQNPYRSQAIPLSQAMTMQNGSTETRKAGRCMDVMIHQQGACQTAGL